MNSPFRWPLYLLLQAGIPQKKWSSHHGQQKNPKWSTWMQSQKRKNDLCSSLRQAIQYHNNPSLCPNSNAEEAEAERLYEDLQDLVELTPQKRCPFYYRGVECRRRKSRNTWSSRQIWPWNAEWSRAKTNSVLPRKCTGHSKHTLPTTQEKTLHMDITRSSTPKSDWLYSNHVEWNLWRNVEVNCH